VILRRQGEEKKPRKYTKSVTREVTGLLEIYDEM
jgi:hypothetical protein